MNFKQLGVALVLLVVVAAVFGVWASRTPAPQTQAHVLEGAATSTGGYEYAESGEFYTVDLLYPAATGMAPAADQQARLTIETALKAELDSFKQNIDGLDDTVLPSLADGHKLLMSTEYKTYSSTVLPSHSFLFTIFEDTGGAHPNTYFKTFVFDDATGSQVQLSDLFDPSTNWLQELSLLVSNDVVAQAKQRLGQDDVTGAIFADGLAPKAENFQNFLLDGDTLVVEIPPYQVAAYVMGSFEVRIPFSEVEANFKK